MILSRTLDRYYRNQELDLSLALYNFFVYKFIFSMPVSTLISVCSLARISMVILSHPKIFDFGLSIENTN